MLVAGGSLTPVITFAMRGFSQFALILFETLITTAVAYTLNLWALRRLSVATTTVFNYLQPPTTALMAWFFFGDVYISRVSYVIGQCVLREAWMFRNCMKDEGRPLGAELNRSRLQTTLSCCI